MLLMVDRFLRMRLLPSLLIVLFLLACADSSLGSERLYWDLSDEPGLQGGNGAWSAEAKNWNASADGSGARVGWRPGAVAVFGSTDKNLVLVARPR